MPYFIGITGNIACGKTAVGKRLVELGVERYIDADAVVHQLYAAKQPIAVQVGELFGNSVLHPDGSVNRPVLGKIVFGDAGAMKQLENIVHPAVRIAIQQQLALVSERGIGVIDAVKLLEGGSAAYCQSKWLVTCAQEQQIQRLMKRNNLSLEEAQQRLAAQPDTAARMALVDEVIDNSGTLTEMWQQVDEAFQRFCQRVQVTLP